ncbi:TonB-dependent receptor [Ottowia thiooxydans]|uniref:TonB-dependent receptor n=1 Tax=Ottowia thiooxydans TaxID=219182 RepID=UPI00042910E0|nr:TonB-dependent receptor [Ottowia thiooxydans]
MHYEWDVPQIPSFTLTGGVVHIGKQYYDATNARTLPAWTRLDIGARYAFSLAGKPSVLRLTVQNAANKNYWQQNDRGRIWLGAPRTVLLSMTTNF